MNPKAMSDYEVLNMRQRMHQMAEEQADKDAPHVPVSTRKIEKLRKCLDACKKDHQYRTQASYHRIVNLVGLWLDDATTTPAEGV